MYHTLTGQLEYILISLNEYKYCSIGKFIYVRLHVFMLVWNVGISCRRKHTASIFHLCS